MSAVVNGDRAKSAKLNHPVVPEVYKEVVGIPKIYQNDQIGRILKVKITKKLLVLNFIMLLLQLIRPFSSDFFTF